MTRQTTADIGMTLDGWIAEGRAIAGRLNSSAWELGDWYNRGTSEWQRQHAQSATGLALHTIQNAASVATRFPLASRRREVSFGVHEAIVTLNDEQAFALLDRSPTRAEARAEVRRLVDERTGVAALEAAEVDETPLLPGPSPVFADFQDLLIALQSFLVLHSAETLVEAIPDGARPAVIGSVQMVGNGLDRLAELMGVSLLD